ncbi:MAG: hypothetical protein U5K31_12795 [Balneolaceae bacterium]|nr:hypothetical protein [Balneolaceae bacterium]
MPPRSSWPACWPEVWTTPFRDGPGELQRLQSEVAQMRQVMMLNLIDNGSATERLKAVNISSELNEPEPRVREALIRTLNRDPNVNVRIAAVDALLMRASDPGVRSALGASIARQDSPRRQARPGRRHAGAAGGGRHRGAARAAPAGGYGRHPAQQNSGHHHQI